MWHWVCTRARHGDALMLHNKQENTGRSWQDRQEWHSEVLHWRQRTIADHSKTEGQTTPVTTVQRDALLSLLVRLIVRARKIKEGGLT